VDFGLAIGVARVGVGCTLVWMIARRWSPLLSLHDAGTERGLVAGLIAGWLVTILVAGLGVTGQLGPNRLLLIVSVVFVATLLLRPKRPEPLLPPAGPERLALLSPMLFVAPILLWDLGWRLPALATDWDALTYHLYLPVRWLQAEQLFHIPTVFGDPAAAFAPQNGALLFTWWIALLGGDALTNVVNVLPAMLLGLAIRGLAVRFGLTRENAALAGVAVFWLGPMRSAIFEARVDIPMLAFWSASLLFVARALDPKQPTPWLAAGLATGLAAGTKVVGLSLIGPQALLLAVLLLVRRESRALAGFLTACIAGGGWWFIVNIVQFGNPLFPLDVRIGNFAILPGAIPFGALAGQFHTPLVDLIGRVLPHFYGWTAMAVTGIGFVSLLVSTFRPGTTNRPTRVLTASIALYWALFYFFRLPHNTETRFLLPVVALALIGFAWLLEPIARRSSWLMRGAWALCFAISCIDAERLDEWRTTIASPVEAGVPLLLWIPLGLATAAAFALALSTRANVPGKCLTAAGLLGLSLLVGIAQHHSVESRATQHARSRFQEWSPAMQYIDRLDPAHEMNIAYSGLNLPYTLTGPRLTRPVRYVNSQGPLEHGFHDFWQGDQNLATRQKPGLYRGGGRDDYNQWIRNLEAARIDWLLVFRLHSQERYIAASKEGFPIEHVWAMNHPRRFESIASGTTFELYRFRSIR
jgi:hypothetical protein